MFVTYNSVVHNSSEACMAKIVN